MSEANERLFLFRAAQWKSAIPIYRESNLLTPESSSRKSGSLRLHPPA
jgi:hypothetical protein